MAHMPLTWHANAIPASGLALDTLCFKVGSHIPRSSELSHAPAAGQYCDSAGLQEPVGPCHAGYYCQAGSIKPKYDGENWPDGSGKCPPGHYCIQGQVRTKATNAGSGHYIKGREVPRSGLRYIVSR